MFRPSGGGSPKRCASAFSGVFLASARTASQFAVSGVSAARVRHRSEAVDIKHGQFVRRGLKDVAIVMGLHELALVGGRAPGRRDGWWLQRLAEVCENLPDRPWLRDKGDQPDVTATVWALERELLTRAGHQLCPGNPRGVVRPGLRLSVAAARGMRLARMPTGTGLAPLANIPDRQCRDAPPQLVIGRKDSVVAVPMLPRRRHEIRAVQRLRPRWMLWPRGCSRPS